MTLTMLHIIGTFCFILNTSITFVLHQPDFPPPGKPSPWGEGGAVRAGWGRNIRKLPPHQSPAVTASPRGESPCCRYTRPAPHRSPINWNFTYLDNGNVNFPDNKKYSRSKPTIIRIPPTTLMPIRLTLLFFIILFAKTNSSTPTTIIKTDINGYMSFLLSNFDLLNWV